VIPEDWFPHRRSDGEVVGYIEAVGEEFQPYDLLGRRVGDSCDWLSAEERLDRLDLAWMGEPQRLILQGRAGERRVRILEVTRERLILVDDEFGAAMAAPPAGRALARWEFDLPLEVTMRPL